MSSNRRLAATSLKPSVLAISTSLVNLQQEPEVAATVNGVSILTSDLNLRAQILYDTLAARSGVLSSEDAQARRLDLRWKVLDKLIDDEVKTQRIREAERTGQVHVQAEEVVRFQAWFAQAFPDESTFRQAHPLSVLKRDEYARRSVLFLRLASDMSREVTVSSAEVQEFYAAWPERWKDGAGNPLSFEQAQVQVQKDRLAEKRGQMVLEWLRNQRRAAQIEIALPPPAGGSG